MFARASNYFIFLLLLVGGPLIPAVVFPQGPPGVNRAGRNPDGSAALPGVVPLVDLNVFVKGPNGAPIEGMALVTLSTIKAGAFQQATAMAGYVQFHGVPPSRYTIQVIASGFERAVKEFDAMGMGATMVTIELRPASDGTAVAPGSTPALPVLAPKAQKELGKAPEAVRADKPAEAKSHLDAAQRLAPNHWEISYLFGVYWAQLNDWKQTKLYLARTLEVFPKHVGALLIMGDVLVQEDRPAEALPFLNRAV